MTETEQTAQGYDESQKETRARYLYWGAFVLLFAFGTFAGVGFYSSVMNVIDIWISPDFEPVFRMLFNLTVVLIALLGLSVLARRLDISVGGSDST